MSELIIIVSIIVPAVVMLVSYIAKLIYSSKCNKCRLGCIQIERDTIHEQKIGEISMSVPKVA